MAKNESKGKSARATQPDETTPSHETVRASPVKKTNDTAQSNSGKFASKTIVTLQDLVHRIEEFVEAEQDVNRETPDRDAEENWWRRHSRLTQSMRKSLRQITEEFINLLIGTNFELMVRRKDDEALMRLPRIVNQLCRNAAATLCHPETQNPCYLYGFKDNYGCKFMYEDRATKKRSHTTRDLTTLIPFRLMAEPEGIEDFFEIWEYR